MPWNMIGRPFTNRRLRDVNGDHNLFTAGWSSGCVDASDALRAVKGGVELDIMVTPNAKVSTVGGMDVWRGRLIIKVQAVPADGRANRAVIGLLSERFGVKVEIVRGHTDRHKTVLVPLSLEEAVRRLMP
jgi:uncharacterized protein (TIGR00251 family)